MQTTTAARNQMKVLLIFPPLFTPFRPYLAGPSLCAYLKDKGISVIQKDFNVEAFDVMLSAKYLCSLNRTLDEKLSLLEAKSKLEPGTEQKLYNNLFMAKSMVNSLAANVEEAKGKTRNSKTFYDPSELSRARETLNRAFLTISTAYAPTGLNFGLLDIPGVTGSFESLKAATLNWAENPFIQVYEEYLMPFIRVEQPDIVGITIAAESQLIPALTLARMLKSHESHPHVCIGGHVVTVLAETIAAHEEIFRKFIDSAILHEGEQPLLELVEALKEDTPLENVSNLIYLSAEGICVTETVPPLEINLLPTPCFDGLKLDSYFGPEPVLPLLSSRGCYWNKCAFCGHTLGWGGGYQVRSTEKVIGDIRELVQKHGTRHFAFCDEGIAPASMNRLSDQILESGLNIRCSTNIRLEQQFTPELCRKMAAAGFRLLSLGLESSCERVLDLMSKGTSKDTAIEVCRNVFGAGIWNHVYLMLGFPGETLEEATETIEFLATGQDKIRSFFVENFSLGKGSIIYKNPERFGVTKINDGPENEFRLSCGYSVSSGITPGEASELAQFCMTNVAPKYESEKLLALIGYRYDKDFMLPLYLSHFEHEDPLLKSVFSASPEQHGTYRRIDHLSTPRIKRGIVSASLKFNLALIRRDIIAGNAVTAFANPTQVLFNPDSLSLIAMAGPGLEILALCDGKSTLTQIALELVKKYRARFETVEADCLAFVEAMAAQGYIEA